MLSFVLFKTTVIVFTSIEGAALFVFGTCALLMHYAPWQKQVSTSLDTKPILLPLVITTLAMIALFWQHQKHGLIGHEGAPGGAKPAAPAGDAKKK
jgi:ABC-type spermidine/putrescine transport system permease subunit II